MKKLVNGVLEDFTKADMDARKADQKREAKPPTKKQKDAKIDGLLKDLYQGQSLIRALGRRVYLLEKAANPSLTDAQFKKLLHEDIAGQ